MHPDRAELVASVLSRLSLAWSCPDLAAGTAVRFSSRLTRSVARADPLRSAITVSSKLPAEQAIVDEVICHEAAHLLAFARVGRSEKPHGPTWQALVREGGHEPRLRLAAAFAGPDDSSSVGSGAGGGAGAGRPATAGSSQGRPRRFRPHCLVCDFSRVAGRRMSAWRCGDCVAAGLAGKLAIVELPVAAKLPVDA